MYCFLYNESKRDTMEHIKDFESEFEYKTARSSGSGGQHINKVETKVFAYWNLQQSQLINDTERSIITQQLSGKIDETGFIFTYSQATRSQLSNKALAIEKLNEIINNALIVKPPRKKTQKPRAAKEATLEYKKNRSEIKSLRKPIKNLSIE